MSYRNYDKKRIMEMSLLLNSARRAHSLVYQETGFFIASDTDFYKSSFYPFADNISRITHNHLEYYCYKTINGIVLKGKIHHNGNVSNIRVSGVGQSVDLYKETVNRMNFYLLGVKGQSNLIKDVREDFITSVMHDSPEFANMHSIRFKDFMTPNIKGDLPENEWEVQQYNEWTMKNMSVFFITDAWNHNIRIELGSKYIKCVSAGSDGVFNTNDDIVVKRSMVR